MNRRVFMKSGAMALATMGLNPTFLRRTVFAQDLLKGAALKGNGRGKVLVVLFQRGAADALNVVVPHGERAYYAMRPSIAIPRPVSVRRTRRSISTDSSGYTRPSRRSSACGTTASSHRCTRSVGRATRDHTSTRRTTWRAARPTTRARATVAQSLSRGQGHVRRVQAHDANGAGPRESRRSRRSR